MYSGAPTLYRAWLYGGPDVTRKRTKGKAPRVRFKTCPPSFRIYLASYRPDADPERYWRWRGDVLKACGWRCAGCGTRDRLDAHHIKYWKTDVRRRYDPKNGLALCRGCHGAMHGPFRIPLGTLGAPTLEPRG
jgi:hypothetical protein